VDFADVQTVMKDSGVAIMGSATADGEKRAIDAIQAALESPLLNNNAIQGAKNILLNITSGVDEITMDEVGEITDYVQETVGDSASIIWGTGNDESLQSQVCVTIIATGFASGQLIEGNNKPKKEVTRFSLDENVEVIKTDAVPKTNTQPTVEPAEEKGRVVDFELLDREKEDRIDRFYQPIVPPSNRRSEVEHFNPAQFNWDDQVPSTSGSSYYKAQVNQEEIEDERLIEQLENVPAYKRKNLNIANQKEQQPEENKVSRFSLSDDGKNGPSISRDNPYLHDNVD